MCDGMLLVMGVGMLERFEELRVEMNVFKYSGLIKECEVSVYGSDRCIYLVCKLRGIC